MDAAVSSGHAAGPACVRGLKPLVGSPTLPIQILKRRSDPCDVVVSLT